MALVSVAKVCEELSSKVFFFSKDGCVLCDKLESQLRYMNIPHQKVKLSNAEEIAELVSITSYKMFPQLFFGTHFVGGFSDFEKLCYTNQLAKKLEPLGINPDLDF